jgi:hypothetical protein
MHRNEWLLYIIYSYNIRWHLYMDTNFSGEVGVLKFFPELLVDNCVIASKLSETQ